MKWSIRGRMMLLSFAGVFAVLLAVGIVALYGLYAAQSKALHLDRELYMVGEDVEFMADTFSRILKNKENYRPRTLPNTRDVPDIVSGQPYVHYSPDFHDGNGELQAEIALAANFADGLESISKSYDPRFDEPAKPGTKYAYADYNGALFGCLIEAITGESVQDYMDRTVFKPLGLTAAYSPKYLPAGTPTKDLLKTNGSVGLSVADDLSYNYNNTANPRMNNGYTVGGLYINTGSLTKLAQMMLSGGELNGARILNRATVSLMEADQPGLASSKYGLGTVRLDQFPRGTWYGHQGRYLGLTSNVYYQIDTGITLALVMDGYDYQLQDNIVMPAVTLLKNMETLEKNAAGAS